MRMEGEGGDSSTPLEMTRDDGGRRKEKTVTILHSQPRDRWRHAAHGFARNNLVW